MTIDNYLESSDERYSKDAEPFPEKHYPEPTSNDYERGWFERFFARRRGTQNIVEISKDDYDVLDTSRLFIRFSFKWRISGPREDVFNDAGFQIRSGVEDTNLRTLDRVAKDHKGIKDKLSDPLQFWDERDD